MHTILRSLTIRAAQVLLIPGPTIKSRRMFSKVWCRKRSIPSSITQGCQEANMTATMYHRFRSKAEPETVKPLNCYVRFLVFQFV